MDYTKLENTIKLYHYYAPKFVMWGGKPHRVMSLPHTENYFKILTDDRFLNKGAEVVDIREMMHTVVISECRLMLRNPNSLTEHELKEFGKFMFWKDLIGCHAVGQFEAILVSFFSDKRVDGIDRVVYEVNENMPLKAAQWFFKKQINFLSLPPEIAVEVDNTNDTKI